MTEQNEPSMEAILASIRNILAEDEDETPEAPAKSEASAKQEAPAEKIETAPEPPVEKVEEVKMDEAPEKQTEPEPVIKINDKDDIPASETEEQPAENDVMDLTADMIVDKPSSSIQPDLAEAEEEDDFTPEPVIPQEPPKEETLTDLIKETAARKFEDDMLLAEPTVMAATESLSHLRDIATERQLNLGNGALTIEAIVRETLKPYLKEWLDAHLPDIVERVVRKEVAHIMDRLDLK